MTKATKLCISRLFDILNTIVTTTSRFENMKTLPYFLFPLCSLWSELIKESINKSRALTLIILGVSVKGYRRNVHLIFSKVFAY